MFFTIMGYENMYTFSKNLYQAFIISIGYRKFPNDIILPKN